MHAPTFCFQHHRHGGVSTGTYASLNCTPYTGDSAENVLRNQGLLLEALPQRPQELVIPGRHTAQHPSSSTPTICRPTRRHATKACKASTPHHPRTKRLSRISTADCIPILLYDHRHQAIAAVHAGWRGTVNRIVRHTLERMQTLYGTEGKDVQAVIGPGISLAAFEVGEEVYEAFRTANFPMPYIAEWHNDTHKHHIDLWAANQLQLLGFGLPDTQIETAGICTYTRHEDFFCPQVGNQVGQDAVGNHDEEL